MSHCEIKKHFVRVREIVLEIDNFVPEGTKGATDLRADLAGLLIVAIAASYESCVKDVMIRYAATKHVDFERFTLNNFNKLSSRIAIADLHKYAALFDDQIAIKFKAILKNRKQNILSRTGHNIEVRYNQILAWRHDYAHAGIKNTTIREAYEFHVYAKRVLYCFDLAFE
jgi:hypothetical protein